MSNIYIIILNKLHKEPSNSTNSKSTYPLKMGVGGIKQ